MSIPPITLPIDLQLEDSCNCSCCFPPSENTTIYVNHKYEVEYFDHRKSSSPKEDHKKTFERIVEIVKHNLCEIPEVIKDKEEFCLNDINLINDYIKDASPR